MIWILSKIPIFLLRITVYFCAYLLSFFGMRSKSIWIFGEGKSFKDNSKYVFIYMSEHVQGVKTVWLSKNNDLCNELIALGYVAYHPFSWQGVIYSLRAGVYVYSYSIFNTMFWLSGGAYRINLWHGIPLKQIEYDARTYSRPGSPSLKAIRKYLAFNFWIWSGKNPDKVLVTSQNFVDTYIRTFQCKSKSQALLCGQPRNDSMLTDIKNALLSSEQVVQKQIDDINTTHILYMPTFRDSGKSVFADVIDFKQLQNFLKKLNITLWLKAHPNDRASLQQLDVSKNKNIQIIEGDVDMYPLLSNFSVLITDYSSIYFDFLLLDRPIVFFAHDLDEYLAVNRAMYFDYNDITPGPKAKNQTELELYIASSLSGEDDYVSSRKKVREFVYDSTETATPCVVDKLTEYLKL